MEIFTHLILEIVVFYNVGRVLLHRVSKGKVFFPWQLGGVSSGEKKVSFNTAVDDEKETNKRRRLHGRNKVLLKGFHPNRNIPSALSENSDIQESSKPKWKKG
ncbi:hypothetical protein U1Q18_039811 [Sarracenia purpurea var. burkii]